MALYNLWMGGARTANVGFPMLPSAIDAAGAAANAMGYADHQRRRSYAVTRHFTFTPRVPYGGAYVFADQKDWDWYTTLVAGGANVAAADVWFLGVIPPYTRVEWLAIAVYAGVTGLDFTLELTNSAGTQIGTLGQITVNGAVVKVPTTVAVPAADQQAGATPIYMSAVFTAVPGTAGVAKLQNLDFSAQMEVVDWGSLDFNGNA
jgi:hypothetical protein